MHMGVHKDEATTVLGPCPGCENWQLDYTNDVAQQFATMRVETVEEFGVAEEAAAFVAIDMSEFHAVVEEILREHLDECVHLQRLLGDFWVDAYTEDGDRGVF